MSVPGAVLTPWKDEVPAILTNFMPGQAAGDAVADVLFGKVNPSARLPLTFPNKENEQDFSPAQYPGLPDPAAPLYANYTEGLFVGYRYYDKHQITPAFAFGHGTFIGFCVSLLRSASAETCAACNTLIYCVSFCVGLSYTTFGYSDLTVSGRNISVEITNTGKVAGAEIPQLYLEFPEEADEPPQVLRGFETVMLQPGAKEVVTFPLGEHDTSIWSTEEAGWKPIKGAYTVKVGASSRDIRLTKKAAF